PRPCPRCARVPRRRACPRSGFPCRETHSRRRHRPPSSWPCRVRTFPPPQPSHYRTTSDARTSLRAFVHPALDPFRKSPSTYSEDAVEVVLRRLRWSSDGQPGASSIVPENESKRARALGAAQPIEQARELRLRIELDLDRSAASTRCDADARS